MHTADFVGAIEIGKRARDPVAHFHLSNGARVERLNMAGDTSEKGGKESATLDAGGGTIAYRFHARDLHLVLGPAAGRKPVRFRVTVDGHAPGADHGVDTDAAGRGVVDGQRLYQLVRQSGTVRDRTFEIELLDHGVQAFSFTFG